MSYRKILWGGVLIIFCIEIIWITFASFSFYFTVKNKLTDFMPLIVLCLTYVVYKKFFHQPLIVRCLHKIPLILEALFFVYICVTLMLIASYLAATMNYPFVDSIFASTDNYFGINSPDIVFWFREHIRWYLFFGIIYDTYFAQFPFIILYFGLRGERILLQRFLSLFFISAVFTIILSGFFPAAGPYVWYQYSPSHELLGALNQLYELRNNVLDISNPHGIVTFPSFHAIMAFIYMYIFRNESRYIFIPIIILNILMIFSCLPIGQHYFTDLLGAIPVFLLTIWIERYIFSYVVTRNPSFSKETTTQQKTVGETLEKTP